MGLFSRLFGDKDPMPEVHEDAMAGLPAGPLASEHASQGNWRQVREMLAAEPDPARRWRYVNIVADGLGDHVAEWLEAAPDDADAWLVTGLQAIDRGAQIRGAAKADDVEEDRWDPFHTCMAEAEQALARAAELAPEDPLPWVALLTTAMTLGAPVEERVARFEEARRRAPALTAAHLGILMALTEKWGGSHQRMFESARRSLESAPRGSSLPAVLALAHVERWLYIRHWEDDEDAWRGYFRRPEVLREVRDCHRRCAGVEPASAAWVANIFAFCFYLADDARAARQEFEKAKGRYTGLPWDYHGGAKGYADAMKAIWRRGAPPRPLGR